jgi:DNA-binding NtrC family response regulator
MILVKGDRVDAGDLAFGRRAQTARIAGPADYAPDSWMPEPGSLPLESPASSGGDGARPLAERLLDEERRQIIAAVDKSHSNIAGAARILGINRSTLYYRMRKHGLEHLLPTKVGVGGAGIGGNAGPAGVGGSAASTAGAEPEAANHDPDVDRES